MINYDLHRGINVSTEPDNKYSELVISQTTTSHSGNYSCVTNNAISSSTLVHIFNGENPAAMQHGDYGHHHFLIQNFFDFNFIFSYVLF
ncbi:unnamed protein product [Diamesa hyperborea]